MYTRLPCTINRDGLDLVVDNEMYTRLPCTINRDGCDLVVDNMTCTQGFHVL